MSINIDNYDDLVEAEYLDSYNIKCTFKNGKQGILNLNQYSRRGGVFSRFCDLEYFKNFHIDNGVLVWGDGEIDIAPETLYHKVTGEPLPEWMEQ